jgi:enoyl-CoA hydratase/carnithine racemase
VTANLPSQVRDAPGWLSVRQLADGMAQVTLLGAAWLDWPLALVDLDTPADKALLAAASRAAEASERILVGVQTCRSPDEQRQDLLESLDLTLTPNTRYVAPQCVALPDPVAAACALRIAATSRPQASVVLAQVLRATARLAVPAALNVESLAYSALLGGTEFQRWLASRTRRQAQPTGPEPAVIASRNDAAMHMTLNRPARRNAYSRELRDALVEALMVPALDETITSVIITGAGPSFCSGGDLDEFGMTPDPVTAHFVRTSAGAAGLLHRIASRTEVRVHGASVGAGVELAAFASRVVADPGATFRLPEVGMGLIPGAGGTVSIPRRIGRWRTLYLALSGAVLDAQTATHWNLADEIAEVPDC